MKVQGTSRLRVIPRWDKHGGYISLYKQLAVPEEYVGKDVVVEYEIIVDDKVVKKGRTRTTVKYREDRKKPYIKVDIFVPREYIGKEAIVNYVIEIEEPRAEAKPAQTAVTTVEAETANAETELQVVETKTVEETENPEEFVRKLVRVFVDIVSNLPYAEYFTENDYARLFSHYFTKLKMLAFKGRAPKFLASFPEWYALKMLDDLLAENKCACREEWKKYCEERCHEICADNMTKDYTLCVNFCILVGPPEEFCRVVLAKEMS